MGPVADEQPALGLDPLPGQGLDLLEQGRRVDHHAVADHAVDPRPEQAGRHQRELVRDPVGDDRVAGVRPALIPHDHVVPVAEPVHDLPLGLIAPLKPHDAGR